MPLLYGEEEKAFLRLQTEIISSCPDTTIFAWTLPNGPDEADESQSLASNSSFSGVLASSPSLYHDCAEVQQLEESFCDFSLSNRGIKLRGQFWLHNPRATDATLIISYVIILPICRIENSVYGIQMRNVGMGCFVRENPDQLVHIGNPRAIIHRHMLDPFLLTQLPRTVSRRRSLVLASRQHVLQIVLRPGMEIYRRWPWQQWDESSTLFFGSDGPTKDTGWASLKMVAVYNHRWHSEDSTIEIKTKGTLDFLFYAFAWTRPAESNSPLPSCAIRRVHGTPEVGARLLRYTSIAPLPEFVDFGVRWELF